MPASTVGFTDTRKDTNHIGRVISRILEARQLAEDERKYAEAQAEKYQTSLEESGIERGYFFKKALRWKFGGEFKQKKLAQLNTWKTRGGLLKDAVTGKSGQNKLDKFERSQAIFDMFKASDKPGTFRDKFKPLYKGFVDDPMLRPMSRWYEPSTAKKIQKATTRKKRVSKEDILDSLGGITEAIQKVADSISEKNKAVSDQMMHSAVLQKMMYDQLKTDSSSLDDKLKRLIDAVSNQTYVQKQNIEKEKSKRAADKLKEQSDVASTQSFDDLTTPEDESKVGATSAQNAEHDQMAAYGGDDIPKAESGGTFLPSNNNPYPVELHGKEASVSEKGDVTVYRGPNSGYPVDLEGGQRIIPIDNNATRGLNSAVTGKPVPKPKQPAIPQFERGTKNVSSPATSAVSSKFGFNAISNIVGTAGGGTTEVSKLSQGMTDAMSLVIMGTGGYLLSSTNQFMESLGGEGYEITSPLERIGRNIANVFGLPSSIANITKKKKAQRDVDDQLAKEKDKGWLGTLMDGFGKLLEKLSDGINNRPPSNPPGNGDIDYTNLKGGDISTTAGKVATLYDEFRNLGWTEEASKRMIAEIGREGSMQNQNLFGTHTDPAARIPNTGMISWNAERRDKLIAGARQAGVWDESKGQFKETAEALRYQARFLKAEIDQRGAGVPEAMTTPGYSGAKISQLLRDKTIVYRPDYAGGVDAEFGSKKTREWYETHLNLDEADLEATRNVQQPMSQKIQKNYGVGAEGRVRFQLNGKWYNAYKTTNGFDFYDEGPTALPVDDEKITDPQKLQPVVKAFEQYMESRVNNRNTAPAPTQKEEEDNRRAYLNREAGTPSAGEQVAILNLGGKQPGSSATTVPQPSGDNGAFARENPLSNHFITTEGVSLV